MAAEDSDELAINDQTFRSNAKGRGDDLANFSQGGQTGTAMTIRAGTNLNQGEENLKSV